MDITVSTGKDVGLRNALVVVGTPTLGLVGTITAQYLVHNLKMPHVGGLHSTYFQPVALVRDGHPMTPVRIHAIEAKCGGTLACDRIVVITSEFLPGGRLVHEMVQAIVNWAREQSCAMLVVPDGVASDDEAGEKLWGVASNDAAATFLQDAKVAPLAEGVMTGFTASFLTEGARLGLPVVALLADTAPTYPDAKAAARIVSLLDKVIPAIHIDTAPLLKDAEDIEASIRAMQADVEAKAQQPRHGPSMFS